MTELTRRVKFHFYEGNQIGAMLIRARLSSRFAHVAMEFDNGFFYHSLMFKGTVKVPRKNMNKGLEVSHLDLPPAIYERVLAEAEAAVGKEYDVKAILGFILNKQLENTNALFCSEFGRNLFETGTGVKLKYFNLVTPGQLRLILDAYNQGYNIAKH